MREMFQIPGKRIVRGSVMLALLIAATHLVAQPVGQWDFNNGDLSATVGAEIIYTDGAGGATQLATSFGSTTNFGIPDISGAPAKVMKFPTAVNGMGYLMPTPSTGNGGGSLVNEYTVIFDVLYPPESDLMLRPLIDTDDTLFVPGPDVVISASNGVGPTPGGPFAGTIAPSTWNRIGIVVQQDKNALSFYINGT